MIDCSQGNHQTAEVEQAMIRLSLYRHDACDCLLGT